MTKAYVLMGGYVEDVVVLGVFSSMKKANEAREWLLEIDAYYKKYPGQLSIDVFEMNGERIER